MRLYVRVKRRQDSKDRGPIYHRLNLKHKINEQVEQKQTHTEHILMIAT